MSRTSAKEQLVDFLERHAFQPVLRAKESSVPKGKQDELQICRTVRRPKSSGFATTGLRRMW